MVSFGASCSRSQVGWGKEWRETDQAGGEGGRGKQQNVKNSRNAGDEKIDTSDGALECVPSAENRVVLLFARAGDLVNQMDRSLARSCLEPGWDFSCGRRGRIDAEQPEQASNSARLLYAVILTGCLAPARAQHMGRPCATVLHGNDWPKTRVLYASKVSHICRSTSGAARRVGWHRPKVHDMDNDNQLKLKNTRLSTRYKGPVQCVSRYIQRITLTAKVAHPAAPQFRCSSWFCSEMECV